MVPWRWYSPGHCVVLGADGAMLSAFCQTKILRQWLRSLALLANTFVFAFLLTANYIVAVDRCVFVA
jgi:hypothetical protein